MLAQDAKGNIVALTYFGRASYTAKKQLPVGEKRWVAGRLDRYGDMLQIVHPDHVAESSAGLMGSLVEPIYPLAEGLTQPRILAMAEQALHLSRMMERYKLGDQQASAAKVNPPSQRDRRDAPPIRQAPAARSGKRLQAVPKGKVASADWNEF